MHILNPTDGIVRIDVDDAEYLFPAGASIDVPATHVAAVLREHPEMTIGTAPAATAPEEF